MIHDLSDAFPVLQLILVPGLIVVVLALIVIIIGLMRELQRFRSLQQSPQTVRPSLMSPPPEPKPREEVVKLSSQSGMIEPSSPPQQVPPNLDDPLNNRRWLNLVGECVALFDDLDRHLTSFDPSCQELAEHVLLQLQEILERSDVEIITGDAAFERHRHQPEQPNTGAPPGTPIVETLSPGFAVGRRVLRRARVRLAEGPS